MVNTCFNWVSNSKARKYEDITYCSKPEVIVEEEQVENTNQNRE